MSLLKDLIQLTEARSVNESIRDLKDKPWAKEIVSVIKAFRVNTNKDIQSVSANTAEKAIKELESAGFKKLGRRGRLVTFRSKESASKGITFSFNDPEARAGMVIVHFWEGVNEEIELEEKVQPLPDHILSSSLEEIMAELEKRMAAARRAMGLANKLKDEAEWKKHMSAIRGNMNSIQAAIKHVNKQLDPANIASARMTQFQKKGKSPRKSAARDMLGLREAAIKSGDWVKAKKDHKAVAGVVERVDGDTAYVRTHHTNKVVPVNVSHLTKSMNESAEKPEFYAFDIHHNPDNVFVHVRNVHNDSEKYYGISVVIDDETNKIDLVAADPTAEEEIKKYGAEIEAIGKAAAYEAGKKKKKT